MTQSVKASKITVHRPLIHPIITAIGYGNPRYNSIVAYKQGVLVTVGSHVRWVDIENNTVLFDKQIGCCQVFQLMENSKYILVINFDGLISLLDKENLELKHQFYAPGKEIRHSCLTDWQENNYLAVSCELNEGTHGSVLAIYSLEKIQAGIYEPLNQFKGHFYYPEYYENCLTVIEYNDPNPKGRKRKDTVLNKKLPITNKIIKFTADYAQSFSYNVQSQGEVICAAQNNGIIYYLHNSKKVTVFDIKNERGAEVSLESKSYPLLVQKYEDGVVFGSACNVLSKIRYDFQSGKLIYSKIEIKSPAINSFHAFKFSSDGLYSLNQTGLHFYNKNSKKTFTQSLFSITNCGLTFNQTGDKIAVADFGGSLHIFDILQTQILPLPLHTVFVGAPIRSIAWCCSTNKVFIGCVGGSLFEWQYGAQNAKMVYQIEHSINILRAVDSQIYAGVSDGTIKIFDSATMNLKFEFKAHHPIHYKTEQQRQLFGSMKNYAEIWSLTQSPHRESYIISSSEDQTEKVFKLDVLRKEFSEVHHLKGHELAVTSIDWKIMNESLGQIYVSCSDDKIIRFRDPKNDFKVMFEVETSTIKEWHTLTYLALQPKGTRVAVGSQNGYLFIYDILKKELQFGEKIHLGGIQGLDWKNGKIITCSSDLCLNIIEV